MTYEPQYFKGWENFEFQTDSKNYNSQIAWWLAQCSQLSYENKITVATELRAANFNHVIFFDTSGTQAFLAKHPGVKGGGKFAILAFRGTEQDSIDILTDINFVTRLFPSENLLEKPSQEAAAIQKEHKRVKKLYAHGGFLQGIQNVWGSAVRKEIQNLYPEAIWQGAPGISEALCELEPGVSLYFTGHSLGGALATLAAYKSLVYQSSVQVTALYTFGSPRTVQRPLAEAINRELSGKIYRVVNSIDVIPRLPPRIPVFLNFHHINTLIYFTQNHEQRRLSILSILLADVGILAFALIEVVVCLLSFKMYIPKTIKKHMISEYIEDIEKEIKKSPVQKFKSAMERA